MKTHGWEGLPRPMYAEVDKLELITELPNISATEPPAKFSLQFPILMNISEILEYEAAGDVLWAFEQSIELSVDKILEKDLNPQITIAAIVGELCRLPGHNSREIFYSTLILKLTQATAQDATYINAWIGFVEFILPKLAEMDFECVYRFAALLAHFIANKDFSWQWETISSLGPPVFLKILL
jgi:hypothetical protein